MKKLLFSLIILILAAADLFPQEIDSASVPEDFSVVVDSIVIVGNDVTKNAVILRELTFNSGDVVTSQILQFNQDRIYSLGLFTKVKLYLRKNDDLNILLIYVEESWYIYPVPFIELRDKDWNKVSYGFDLVIKNFRGMNETLRARAAFGFDSNYFLYYDNPFLIRDEDIFFSSMLSYGNTKNKSEIANSLHNDESFKQKIIGGQVQFGKRFGLYNRAGISIGFNYIETPFFIKGISASNQRIDRTFSLGASYTFDTRDLAQFPKMGVYANGNITFKGLGINNINYQIINIDFREYREIINDLIVKWRFVSRAAYGSLVPYYDYSFLGYGERIRGHYNQVLEGHFSYLGSVELNYPFLSDINISLNFIPIVPKELLSYRIALYAELFADAGTARMKGTPVSLNDFSSGYGGGLTLLVLPYNVLRAEFAFDEYMNVEWVFGLGVSF